MDRSANRAMDGSIVGERIGSTSEKCLDPPLEIARSTKEDMTTNPPLRDTVCLELVARSII
jgi:hypothetical protein